MGTIGYGAMYPQSMLAEGLVAAESVVSLIFTGARDRLVFAAVHAQSCRACCSRRMR
jgi:hypothetical protein